MGGMWSDGEAGGGGGVTDRQRKSMELSLIGQEENPRRVVTSNKQVLVIFFQKGFHWGK